MSDSQKALDAGAEVLGGSVTVVKQYNTAELKAEKEFLGSNAKAVEDDFASLYYTGSGDKSHAVIRPPYNPQTLLDLVQNNNTLGQCIAAMEVNVDGTGFDIEKDDQDTVPNNDPKIEVLNSFFKEPYPNTSMTSMRRSLRRDLESTGNAYLEIIRSASGDVVFLKTVPSSTMRLLRLGDAVLTTKTVRRGGKDLTVKLSVRERVFLQKIGTSLVYFKEFGASGDLDLGTGKYSSSKIPAKKRATEIIHFTVSLDSKTPYGVPRWINQTPSVLGSRKAEEHNLDFFNSGGLPPVLITVSGGALAADTKKALENYLNGKGNQHRAAIVEAYSSSGTLASSGAVKVEVERFGSEKISDSMFENYDAKCEERVRGAFRLPPLFVGKAQDYNFATAQASYMVAEAQVFTPERLEFDNIITSTVVKALVGEGYSLKSKPLTAKDTAALISGLTLANQISGVDKQSIVAGIEDATGKTLAYDSANQDTNPPTDTLTPSAKDVAVEPNPKDTVKKADPMETIKLAEDWAKVALDEHDFDKSKVQELSRLVMSLQKGERAMLDLIVAQRVFPDLTDDAEGAMELASCLADMNACSCEA